MAISKSLRAQVMRRDDYTCYLCKTGGDKDNPLQVDHVVPVALGGSDDPSNLATCCRDCNIGKAAVPADAALVESVDDSAREFADMMRNLAAEEYARVDEAQWFLDEWQTLYVIKSDGSKRYLTEDDLPHGWAQSIQKWIQLGLVKQDVEWAFHLTYDKRVGIDSFFKYFAGVMWQTLRDREAKVSELLGEPDTT